MMLEVAQIDFVARARALRPLIEAAAPRIEAGRELTADVLEALHDTGMFRLMLPRELGGGQVAPSVLVEVMEALAMADASVAWCVGQAAGCAMAAAYLPPQAARAAFGDRRAVLAWGAGVRGRAVRATGGWRITADWSFASGSRHATLLGGLSALHREDGTPMLRPDGAPESLTFVFPRHAATVTDDWQTIGLRGTGSDSYAVADLFVSDDFALVRNVAAPHPGTLYRLPLVHIYPQAFGALSLGIARAFADAFVALARDKTPRGAQKLRDSGAIHAILGQAEARLRAARAFLLQTAHDVFADLDSGAPLAERHEVALRLATTYATQEAVAVVDTLYHEAGASAIFTAGPFERRFRDIHAVAQQIQARRANFELVGQRLLGVAGPPLFL